MRSRSLGSTRGLNTIEKKVPEKKTSHTHTLDNTVSNQNINVYFDGQL